MAAPAEVLELVERFARNLDVYKRTKHKEALVRVESIDPFFEALGWDVRNVRGYAEQYKDVVHEDIPKVGGGTSAPDYCCRAGGVRAFFLEAKKPSISVRDNVDPACQLRRFIWSPPWASSLIRRRLLYPTYTVDYTVKQTIGELVEGKATRQIRVLQILDVPCGLGSFLLSVY